MSAGASERHGEGRAARERGTVVTQRDVARAAGVSRALVSLVMSNSPKVAAETRERVLRAAARLNYRPNAMARGLAGGKTRTIGVVLSNIHNPFFAEVLDGIDESAAELGFRVLMATGSARQREKLAVERFLELRVDGLVLIGPRVGTADVAEIAGTTPVAVIGRVMDLPGVTEIINNEDAGAELVVRHMFRLGHRAILHIDGGSAAGAARRREAYLSAMSAAGLGERAVVLAGGDTDLAGAVAAEQLLDRGMPTAIFAANDALAVGALNRLASRGISVPRDLSLVGYDNTYLAALHHVALTTVNQPRFEMGRIAMRSIADRLAGTDDAPVRHCVAPELVVRSTTGRPPAEPRNLAADGATFQSP